MNTTLHFKTTIDRRKKISDLRMALAQPSSTEEGSAVIPTERDILELAIDELYSAVARQLKALKESEESAEKSEEEVSSDE
jgi:hypothetical protein